MHCKHFPGLLASEGSLEQATAELDRTYEQVRVHWPSARPLLCGAVTRTCDALQRIGVIRKQLAQYEQ